MEDIKELEQKLAEAKKNYASAVEAYNNMEGVGVYNNAGYTQADALSDEIDYWEDEISDLEQRIDFAYQN